MSFFNYEKIRQKSVEHEAVETVRVHSRSDGSMAIYVEKCPVFEIKRETNLMRLEIGIEEVPQYLEMLRKKYKESNL